MDFSVRQELVSLIEELAHSGAPSPNEELMKKVKRICKTSDAYVRAAYEMVMLQLRKEHAEIRLSAFQIANELFSRSHVFRELLISDFQKFSQLVAETDPKRPLPLPKPAAQQLKEKSLLAIREWNEKFGEGYPKLKLGFSYLKHNKKVDFDGLVAQSEAVRRRREEREARQRAMLQQRVQEVKQEMRDMQYDIEGCLRHMDSCFNLLLPRFDLPEMELLQPTPRGHSKTFRRRTISSGSFASLGSSSEEEEEEGENLETSEHYQVPLDETGDSIEDGGGGGDNIEDERGGGDSIEDGGGGSCREQLGFREKEVESAADGSRETFPHEQDTACLSDLYGSSSVAGPKKGSVTSGTKGKEKSEAAGEQLAQEKDSVTGGDEREDSSSEDSDVEWEDVDPQSDALLFQEHGLVSRGYSIPIELSTQAQIAENEDNSSIIATLRENHQLLRTKYLKKVNKWLEWFTKAGDEQSLRRTIDLKNRLMSAHEKYGRLKIISREPEVHWESPAREEDPNPEVSGTPEFTEQQKAVQTISTASQWKIAPYSVHPEVELDPTTPQAQFAVLKKRLSGQAALSTPNNSTDASTKATNGSSTTAEKTQSSKDELLARAPVVPFDMDLYHWETPGNPEAAIVPVAQMGSLHRFWTEEQEFVITEDEKARAKCRTITFTGKFEPVKWACRAPLPSGKLCPRKDRYKCPFHGPIIPRDEHGNPVSTTSSESGSHSGSDWHQRDRGNPTMSQEGSSPGLSWLDIQEEVLSQKGLEPAAKKKKGKGKRAKYPGLTDLKAHTDTSRTRLERKILNKKTLRRVADSMDEISAKRFKDKFGYSFNYALNK